MSTASKTPAVDAPVIRRRDIRLDFFRGSGMFIIFFAHVPNNPWSRWIPARFGFSDATEIFVFCSGMASAIAFAKIFDVAGFFIGTARIIHRVWQVYWAHIAIFMASLATMIVIDRILGGGDGAAISYVRRYNLVPFVETYTADNVLGLLTLTYVPNLFDILPMYLVILALIPIVMALSRVSIWLPLVLSPTLWLVATFGYLELPAEPWSGRAWFFNPFCWQLIFFTGFAFFRGWLPAPAKDWRLITLASVIAVVCLVLTSYTLREALPLPMEATAVPKILINKTHLGIVRYVHFLSIAYLAYILAGPMGQRLSGRVVDLCCKVGQQALAVFIASIPLSIIGGAILDQTGRDVLPAFVVNISGCVVLTAVAFLAAWFKSSPWKRPVA